jgi:hypothetical protein
MVLGRTPSGAIKLKTDGGLRAVGCACCESTTFENPCKDCPPFLADFNFSLTGDQVTGLTEFQHPAVVCPSADCLIGGSPSDLSPRTCSDSWDAFGSGPINQRLYLINLYRAGYGFFGAPPTQSCCWTLHLFISGIFEFEFGGYPDLCGVNDEAIQIITSLDPRGVYPMTISAQCVPPFIGGPTEFNFTVTVS